MLFAIDIDQTVCGANAYEVYANFHRDDLGLPIESSTLKQLTSYRDFFFLPQVVAFRQAHEREWNASHHRAIATPAVLQAFSPIEGASQGIKILSTYGEVRYYTARAPEVLEVTQQWLERHHFVHSQQVICCTNINQKILALAQHTPSNEPIVLIDDRGHTHILAMLERMKNETQNLLPRLRIVAFGTSTLPETTLCPLIALSRWDQLPSVLLSLTQETS